MNLALAKHTPLLTAVPTWAVYKVFSCSFEGVIKFRSVIDGVLYSAWEPHAPAKRVSAPRI